MLFFELEKRRTTRSFVDENCRSRVTDEGQTFRLPPGPPSSSRSQPDPARLHRALDPAGPSWTQLDQAGPGWQQRSAPVHSLVAPSTASYLVFRSNPPTLIL